MTSLSNNWTDYKGIGEERAEEISNRWETPHDFLIECREIGNTDLNNWALLSLELLKRVDGVGYVTAGNTIDQMVREIR